ncbi:MAG: hypothetical protein ABR576_02310 [Thermoanaerobaculia bacterium]
MSTEKKPGAGIAREHLQGTLKDPTGTQSDAMAENTDNDQQQSKGGEGKEGGAAGKFTRPFREGGETGRPKKDGDAAGKEPGSSRSVKS